MKSYRTHFVVSAILLALSTVADASKSQVEKAGDILQVLIPLSAYGTTFYMHDTQGTNQFYKSFLSTFVITHALKIAVNEKRPGNNGGQSFPSGHTSAAFQGAAFIQLRYGWKYALPAYAAASFVGWSRIRANKHYPVDVFAGAAIGILSNYYFTSPYKGATLTPYVEKDTLGLSLSMKW
ncbi:Membrane-associated phospholipid phosphatase [hydrothermal vent metagenome]|uniref:Membrane-associated phospholipid phosphatase n=1 Tax=hydrothermal vent metagenome TaxID=652676 RepID=A0A3B1C714_9ZZZZ